MQVYQVMQTSQIIYFRQHLQARRRMILIRVSIFAHSLYSIQDFLFVCLFVKPDGLIQSRLKSLVSNFQREKEIETLSGLELTSK